MLGKYFEDRKVGYSIFVAGRLLLNVFFFTPFIVLYAMDMGFDFSTVMLVESFFGIAVVLLDLPGGHLADRLGPRLSLVIGGIVQGLACLSLVAIPHPIMFWIIQIAFALAISLSRGADSALNNVLLSEGRNFERSEARYMMMFLVAKTVVFFAAGLLALLGYSYTFLATGVTQLVGAFLLVLIPMNARKVSECTKITLSNRMSAVFSACTSSRLIRLQITAMVLVGSAFSTILYLLPGLADRAKIETYQLGSLFAVSTLVASGVSFIIHRSRYRWMIYTAGLVGFVSLLAPSYFLLMLLGAALINASQALIVPQFKAIILNQMGSFGEATAMSVVSTAMMLGFSLVGPIFGVLSDYRGLDVMLYCCTGTFVLGVICMGYAHRFGDRRRKVCV